MVDAFPSDDYTPYGYLDNPFDAGPWFGLESGGVLRSLEGCGFGWFHPERDPPLSAGLRVGVEADGMRLVRLEEFRGAGLEVVSRHHTSRCQTYDFELAGLPVSLAFVLARRQALLCRIEVGRPSGHTVSLLCQLLVSRAARRNARAEVVPEENAIVILGEPGPWYAIYSSHPVAEMGLYADGRRVTDGRHVIGEAYSPRPGNLVGELRLEVGDEAWCAVGRGTTLEEALGHARRAAREGGRLLEVRLEEDRGFWSQAPRLVGQWPGSWRRGWVYDLETTRLMVRPAAGIFRDTWPTWQLFRPRVVLAENALDMMRLGYADAATARRALTTIFREALAANVPCVFANGSLNMVAEGGDACGTSPAWCLPIHSLYLLYLWEPDQEWLRALYPHLVAYVRWWLEHRRDAEGWVVYRCTWEAGEDASPRLDPQRTGHRDIFGEVRPVELQACLAHSALLLARLGEHLGRDEREVRQWRHLYDEYCRRTRSLWDEVHGRFRDQPVARGVASSEESYWGAPTEASPLELTPLLYGVATPEQVERCRSRLRDFLRSPYLWWASWTYVLAEAARACGEYGLAGDVADRVLSHAYPALDRRDGAEVGARPGTSREWWPEELDRNNVSNETYGWGATTATLLLRHLFGFGPAEDTDGVVFELAPSLPGRLLEPGRSYGVANLRYRGTDFDLHYEVESDRRLEARLLAGHVRRLRVEQPGGVQEVAGQGRQFLFRLENGSRHLVRLTLEDPSG